MKSFILTGNSLQVDHLHDIQSSFLQTKALSQTSILRSIVPPNVRSLIFCVELLFLFCI